MPKKKQKQMTREVLKEKLFDLLEEHIIEIGDDAAGLSMRCGIIYLTFGEKDFAILVKEDKFTLSKDYD